MNFFFKMLMAIAVAALFLSNPVNAQSENLNCTNENCLNLISSFATNALLWNYQNNYLNYTSPSTKIDIYGRIVSYYPYFYGGNYGFNYYRTSPFFGFVPQSVFNPANIRNEQAIANQKQRDSRNVSNQNKFNSSGSTLKTITTNKEKNVAPDKEINIIPPNQGWQSVSQKESFFEEKSEPNTVFFKAPESEISCKTLGFEYGVLDVESLNSSSKELRIKNTSSEDFFVDRVFVEENELEFNAFGSVMDAKISKNNSGRVKVTLDALKVERDSVGKTKVKVRGHFEAGKSCIVEKDFLVGVKGSKKAVVNSGSYDFRVPSKIEFAGSGFGEFSLDNLTDSELKITITSGKDAIISPGTIIVPKKSFAQKVFSINQASKNEFIYYTVTLGERVLEQKFSKIVSPALEDLKPQETVLEEKSIIVSGYSSKVEFAGENADIAVAILNTSSASKKVRISISNPPKGVSFNPILLSVGPGETRTLNLQVQDTGIKEFPFSAILSVKFDGKTISRQVVFEKTGQTGIVEATKTQTEQNEAMDFISTGLIALQENALPFTAGLLFLIVALFFIAKILSGNNSHTEAWVTRK